MTHATRTVTALLAAVCLFLASCSKPAGRPKVRIAASIGTLALFHLYLTKSLGFWEQEGIDVELEEFSGSAKSLEAVIGGSADISATTYEQAVQVSATGREVKCFFLLSNTLIMVLVAAPGQPAIHRIEELKGRTVGLSGVGSVSQNWLNLILLRHDMKPADVAPVTIGSGAAAVAAVENRKVDAAFLTSTTFEALRDRRPEIKVLLDLRTAEGTQKLFGVPGIPTTAVVASSRWLAENPDTARRVSRALGRAARWTHDHSPAEIATNLPQSPQATGSDALRRSLEIGKPSLSLDGRMIPGGPEVIRDYLKLVVDPSLNIDLAKTYTNEFLDPQP